jgi:hypothetical protein
MDSWEGSGKKSFFSIDKVASPKYHKLNSVQDDCDNELVIFIT